MSDSLRHVLDLTIERWAGLEEIAGRFEEAWRVGPRPSIEDHLPDDPSVRRPVLIELVHADLEFRFGAGEPARVEEYLERFPELGEDDTIVRDLVAAELELRRGSDPSPIRDGLARLPRQAPESGSPDGSDPFATATVPGRIGKFELREVVGQGSFGIVYRAWDAEAGREVALKVLRPDRLVAVGAADRLLREARSAAGLTHPHIVKIFEAGRSGKICYLASELIRGLTLAELLARGGLTLDRAAGLIACVAEALEFAHRRGVVHRDLKPSNLLIDEEGRPLVVDFGLAKGEGVESTLTLEGDLLGTPGYMSPEQARGEAHDVDGRSDVYSLGVILYELLTGVLPFRGSPRKVIRQVMNDEPAPPRTLNGRAPVGLETICLKAMAKRPEERYPTAGAMADDLRRYLEGRPIRARRAGSLRRGLTIVRKHPARTALVALALIAIPLAAVGMHSQRRQAERARHEAAARVRAEAAALGRLEASRYIFLITLAQREMLADNLGRAEDLLAECPERLRGWEWSYLKHLPRHPPRTFQEHVGIIFDVAFSRGGGRLASAGGDQTVRLRSVDGTGEPLTLRGHEGPVHGVCFRPDGRCLASAGGDGTVRIWGARSGRELRVLRGHEGTVYDVAFSPDGTRLASAGEDAVVKLWDGTTGREVASLLGHDGPVHGVAFRPDGRELATVGVDGTLRIWDAGDGRAIRVLREHKDPLHCVAFSPDGTRLATAGGGGTVRVWDAQAGEPTLTLTGQSGVVFGLGFSPDGTRLATAGSDRRVRLWDVASGQEVLDLRGHSDTVWSVAFSPDGSRLASSGADGQVRLIEAPAADDRSEPCLLTLKGHRNSVRSVAFSPDGRRLVSGGGGVIRLWDADRGEALSTLRGHSGVVFGVAFSPDGSRIASAGGDGTVRTWDAATGRPVSLIRSSPHFTIACVAFSPDGRRLAGAGGGGFVHVWDVESGREILLLEDGKGITSGVAFSPDGSRLATAGGDGSVRVWDATTGRTVATPHKHGTTAYGVAFSPDGRTLASAGADSSLFLWDVKSRHGHAFPMGTGHIVRALAYSPDGLRIATADALGVVAIWDATTGAQSRIIRGHSGSAFAVAFSPDGRRIASGGWDRIVKIWDATPPLVSSGRQP